MSIMIQNLRDDFSNQKNKAPLVFGAFRHPGSGGPTQLGCHVFRTPFVSSRQRRLAAGCQLLFLSGFDGFLMQLLVFFACAFSLLDI